MTKKDMTITSALTERKPRHSLIHSLWHLQACIVVDVLLLPGICGSVTCYPISILNVPSLPALWAKAYYTVSSGGVRVGLQSFSPPKFNVNFPLHRYNSLKFSPRSRSFYAKFLTDKCGHWHNIPGMAEVITIYVDNIRFAISKQQNNMQCWKYLHTDVYTNNTMTSLHNLHIQFFGDIMFKKNW